MTKNSKEENRLATVLAAGVIAAAYHIAGRSAKDAQTAILKWVDEKPSRTMTFGDLWALTNW